MTVTPIRRTREPDTSPQIIKAYAGGKRWGYPLKLKMDAIRMVREQGMTISKVAGLLDVAQGTLKRWLDYYDLKRIPPKGGNEYPVAPQASSPATKEGGTTPEQPFKRKEQIREALGLLKQAVDLLHGACQPKQVA